MSLGYFSAGDSPFFFTEQLQQLDWLPRIWDATSGFGRNLLFQLWIDYPIRLFIKLASSIGLDWWSIDKILWILPVVLMIHSVWSLTRRLAFPHWARIISILVYMANTYSLLLFDGGQRGVMLAYSFVPLVLSALLEHIEEYRSVKRSMVRQLYSHARLGMLLGILIAFDLRFMYLTMIAIGIFLCMYCIHHRVAIRSVLRMLLHIFPVPLTVAVGLHAFWILPAVLSRGSTSLSQEYTSAGMLRFLSVADFSHALSLLHPNWPENLFGKVYFLQPEFLLLPILAFASLLFVTHKKNQDHIATLRIAFFVLLSLIGAFFAKGVQEPMGGIFAWMFDQVPGFVMFRDPTKFYLFTALGYAVAIPYTLIHMSSYLDRVLPSRKSRLSGVYVISVLFMSMWLFMIRPVYMGTVSGNFSPKTVPEEYVRLKDMLISDPIPSRVLWLPTAEKFAYQSDIHPVLTSEMLFGASSISGILDSIDSSAFEKKLRDSGVKYVVVPIDVWRRFFLREYKYESADRERLILALRNRMSQKDTSFTQLAVFVHQPFTYVSHTPSHISTQIHWMKRGLVVSAAVFVLACLILLKYRRHKS